MRAGRISSEVSVSEPELRSLPKIFVLGFNKCGTRSFAEVFERSGIGCVHWDSNRLANLIVAGVKEGSSLNLDKYYPGTNAFCDIISSPITSSDPVNIVEGVEFFEKIFESYPDAYFILNTRNIEEWILSRFRHERGKFQNNYKKYLSHKYGIHCSDEQLSFYWRKIWYKYHYLILEFFQSKPSAKFIVFDIEKSSYELLVDFLSPSYSISGSSFAQKGKTSYDNNLIRIYVAKIFKKLLGGIPT